MRFCISHKLLMRPLTALDLWIAATWEIFRRRQWHPTPVLLPRKSHGGRSLVGCCLPVLPQCMGSQASDTTKRLHFHFSLSCIGEGNGNPLQCSCLENHRDGRPGGLLSMGSHRVGHDWSDTAAAAAQQQHCVSCIKLKNVELVHDDFQVYYILLFCIFILFLRIWYWSSN